MQELPRTSNKLSNCLLNHARLSLALDFVLLFGRFLSFPKRTSAKWLVVFGIQKGTEKGVGFRLQIIIFIGVHFRLVWLAVEGTGLDGVLFHLLGSSICFSVYWVLF